MDSTLYTPVLFLIYNRPDLTRQVFAQIREARPRQLFIAADGPRLTRASDKSRCAESRMIVEQVDWDCQVYRLYREQNLGCKAAVSSAITWFFEQVDRGIILEDDCLPSPCFFPFCEQMLSNYKDDTRVISICGTNIIEQWSLPRYAYLFSYYGGSVGWATWRRAWDKFDGEMKLWKDAANRKYIEYLLGDKVQALGVGRWFDSALSYNKMDTWAIPWFFSRLINSGLCVVPSKNLITNLGFGPDATHTRRQGLFGGLPLYSMDVPVEINPIVVVDREFDRANAKEYGFYRKKTPLDIFLAKARAILRRGGFRSNAQD